MVLLKTTKVQPSESFPVYGIIIIIIIVQRSSSVNSVLLDHSELYLGEAHYCVPV